MPTIFAIALAGALGTLARYGAGLAAQRLLGERFAWGTLTVNLIGCFLIGLVMYLGLQTELVPRNLRVALSIGFLGAFTTFSTFGYETLQFLDERAFALAAWNVVANVVLGLLLAWAGMVAGRLLAGGI